MKISVVASALLALCLATACASDVEENGSGKASHVAVDEMDGSTAAPSAPDATPTPREQPVPSMIGAHLDQADTGYRPRDYRPTIQKGKSIELFLRSTPPGATASMDGKAIGITPTFWSGITDGQSHEFTFVKNGYAMARYRFVATQNGVVHGTLKPLVKPAEARDAASPQTPK